jgi:Domain of unknown function (DUF4136)
MAAAVPLAILIGGCAARTTINHAYSPSASFGSLRSYAWAPGSPIASANSLIEANVQHVADPLLEKKGFNRVTAAPDLVIAIRLDNYPAATSSSYELRILDLNVYRADGQTLIWRGTASGSISSDAASSDLRNTVEGILAAFPPS